MVKIFIGNLACNATPEELRELFEKYGKVSECDIVKNYGFVHMNNMSEAEEAIQNLHQHQLHGWRMNVEMSKGRPKSTTKLHVSNLGEGVTSEVLRAKFEDFGSVVECDIVKDYAFIHMERMEDAMEAIDKLDNTAFKGELSGKLELVVFDVDRYDFGFSSVAVELMSLLKSTSWCSSTIMTKWTESNHL